MRGFVENLPQINICKYTLHNSVAVYICMKLQLVCARISLSLLLLSLAPSLAPSLSVTSHLLLMEEALHYPKSYKPLELQ